MANLSIRNDPSITSSMPESIFSMDPFQTMREMLRWDPLSDLYRALPMERMSRTFSPQFDLTETNEAFRIQADVPGVHEKDLDISLTNNRLLITGKRESEQETKGETYYRAERTWGSFSRAFALPTEVDANNVSAELKSGVLIVHLPKVADAKRKQITVQGEKKP